MGKNSDTSHLDTDAWEVISEESRKWTISRNGCAQKSCKRYETKFVRYKLTIDKVGPLFTIIRLFHFFGQERFYTLRGRLLLDLKQTQRHEQCLFKIQVFIVLSISQLVNLFFSRLYEENQTADRVETYHVTILALS